MKELRLEFGNIRRRPSWWTIVLFAIGLVACVAGGWRWSLAQEQLSQVRAAAAQRAVIAENTKPSAAAASTFTVPSDQVQAINLAVGALNLPWSPLFARVESVLSADTALLALEPDGTSQTMRLVVEARDAGSMFAFVRRLSAPSLFGPGTRLVKHEVISQDPGHPYRFEIMVPWGNLR